MTAEKVRQDASPLGTGFRDDALMRVALAPARDERSALARKLTA